MTPAVKKFTIVTGATGAIGTEIARALVKENRDIILAVRNIEKGEKLRASLLAESPYADIRLLQLDLADEASVRTASQRVEDVLWDCLTSPSGDVLSFRHELGALVNNAGVMSRRYSADALGREMTMVVNYHNTRLLTELLAPLIEQGGAVVFTTSLTRFMGSRHKYPREFTTSTFSQMKAYASSKKALTDFAASFAAAHPELRVNCADPGVVDTGIITMQRWYDPLADLIFRPLIRTPFKGAQPALRALDAQGSGLIYCRRRTHKM